MGAHPRHEDRQGRPAGRARGPSVWADRQDHARCGRLSRVPEMKQLAIPAFVLAASSLVFGQSRLDPGKLLNPGTDSWPTFNGDYSGRRFSTLTKISTANVQQLSLAWVYRITSSGSGLGAIKSTPLQINGVL